MTLFKAIVAYTDGRVKANRQNLVRLATARGYWDYRIRGDSDALAFSPGSPFEIQAIKKDVAKRSSLSPETLDLPIRESEQTILWNKDLDRFDSLCNRLGSKISKRP